MTGITLFPEATLFRIVEEIGPPMGPTRAVAAVVRDEWLAACTSPEWVAQLLGEAASAGEREERRGLRLPR